MLYNKLYYKVNRDVLTEKRREKYLRNREVEKQKALARYHAKKILA
jgi:hypothetical protein